jgi:HEAT repeat protein
VAIKASSSRQIDALVTDLASADAVKREAAIARLTVLGARAVERVATLAASTAAGPARSAAFRTLEGIANPRAFEPALQALADADQGVAVAAIAVVRLFVRSARAAAAVDRLTAVTLDRRRPEPVRLAALRALRDLEAATIAPLLKSLSADPSQAIRGAAAAPPAQRLTERDPLDALAQAANEGLPDDQDAIRLAIVQAGSIAPLPQLLKIVERVRDREGSPASSGRRGDNWAPVRASAHVALAERGSRLGVYDLRESLERSRTPLPVEFLTALSLAGDASCLEAIVRAHADARDAWWRDHLAWAFQAIVARERLTKRHAALRRVEQRWPGALERLLAGRAGRARGTDGARNTER